jgi:hypothetical protein
MGVRGRFRGRADDKSARLTELAAFLYAESGRYWFFAQPILNRLAEDRARAYQDMHERCSRALNKTVRTVMQIVRIGMDLEMCLRDSWSRRAWQDGGAQDASPSCRINVLREPATLPHWHGGFERRTLLGEGAFRPGSRCPTDQSTVRHGLREVQQERSE